MMRANTTEPMAASMNSFQTNRRSSSDCVNLATLQGEERVAEMTCSAESAETESARADRREPLASATASPANPLVSMLLLVHTLNRTLAYVANVSTCETYLVGCDVRHQSS